MKKKTKTWIKIGVGIMVVVGAIFAVKGYVNQKIKKANTSSYQMYSSVPVERKDLDTYTRGSGIFTSFHIAPIKVEEGLKILQQYVKDGEQATKDYAIFLVSDGYESRFVTTPINGLFFERQTENMASSYHVYDTTDTGITIQVSENEVAKLQVGQPSSIVFPAINKEFQGEVTYISKIAENGNFPVRIRIPYQEDLRFGYNGSVKITTSSSKQALCIPYNAVQFEKDKAFVVKKEHLKEANKTTYITEEMKTYIKVGANDTNYVEVLEGLDENDQVLIGNM